MRTTVAIWAIAVLMLATSSCNRQQQPAQQSAPQPPPYTPGLGEIMTMTQMRHSKLWFAGQAGNWPLAAYELDELKEGFDDAVTFHPTHKDAPLPISELIPKMTTEPLQELAAAVGAKDRDKFAQAFDNLTNACNGCHRAANFGFNVVGRPTENPYTNQIFQPTQ